MATVVNDGAVCSEVPEKETLKSAHHTLSRRLSGVGIAHNGKTHQFDSRSGHHLGCRFSPQWGARTRGDQSRLLSPTRCFPPSLCPSFAPSLKHK